MFVSCLIFTLGECEGLALIALERKYKNFKYIVWDVSGDRRIRTVVSALRKDVQIFHVSLPHQLRRFIYLAFMITTPFFNAIAVSYPVYTKNRFILLKKIARKVLVFQDSLFGYQNSKSFDPKILDKGHFHISNESDYVSEGNIIRMDDNLERFLELVKKHVDVFSIKYAPVKLAAVFTKYVPLNVVDEYHMSLDEIVKTLVYCGYMVKVFKHPRESVFPVSVSEYISNDYYVQYLNDISLVVSYHSSVASVFNRYSDADVFEVYDNNWFTSGVNNKSRFLDFVNFSGTWDQVNDEILSKYS